MPKQISLSNVFIDDILLSNGQMYLGVLGGSGVHALAGARVWSKSLGLLASIGKDFDQSFLDVLGDLNIDTSLLDEGQEKTTRAWQIFQPDEERIQVYRDKNNAVRQVSLESLAFPESYKSAQGFHVNFSDSFDLLEVNLKRIRELNPAIKIVLEPTTDQTEWGENEYKHVLPLVDVFSPNALEAMAITNKPDPGDMADELLSFGAKIVIIRMGEAGSLLAEQDQNHKAIPAVKTKIVDVTGAGNAYMGGLLVGLCDGLPPVEAAMQGAVSASFAIQQYGVCMFNESLEKERDRRFSALQNS